MTVVGSPATPKPSLWRRRRSTLIVTAVVVLLAALITTVSLRALDHRYGPVEAGSWAGPYSPHGFVDSKDGFSYSLSSTPGATGQLIVSLDNRGLHSVKVTSIDTDAVVTDIRWSSYRFVDGGSVFGVDTPWHPFPAIVPARGTIRLLITIHHPDYCAGLPKGGSSYDSIHEVHWESLLAKHTTFVDDRLGDRNIGVC